MKCENYNIYLHKTNYFLWIGIMTFHEKVITLYTRMHSSRMHTVRCGGCRGCLPRGVSAWGCLPGGVYPSMHWAGGYVSQHALGRGLSAPVHAEIHPSWTEFLTHTCENITFPQLRLQTVINISSSRGGARVAHPTSGPNSFFFMQFSAKNLRNNRLAHPLWELAPFQENPGSATDSFFKISWNQVIGWIHLDSIQKSYKPE